MLFIEVLLNMNFHVVHGIGVSIKGKFPLVFPEYICILETVHLNYKYTYNHTMEA